MTCKDTTVSLGDLETHKKSASIAIAFRNQGSVTSTAGGWTVIPLKVSPGFGSYALVVYRN